MKKPSLDSGSGKLSLLICSGGSAIGVTTSSVGLAYGGIVNCLCLYILCCNLAGRSSQLVSLPSGIGQRS